MQGFINELFRCTGRVTRDQYLRAGILLLALKYADDALVFFLVIGEFWCPLDYLNPIYARRMASAPGLEGLPSWYVAFLLLWGLFFFVPFCNYALILTLLLWPTATRAETEPPPTPAERSRQRDMAPEVYWRMWADAIIHRIHGRVLRHVKSLSGPG